MSADTQDARLAQRVADLYANDKQFAGARPDPEVNEAISSPDMRLPQIVRAIAEGYANRPALGQRTMRAITDPGTGRAVAEWEDSFEVLTYKEMGERIEATAAALAEIPVCEGDRVCTLGFSSADYITVDLAAAFVGAVSVPLQTSAGVDVLAPMVSETAPTLVATDIKHLPICVELSLKTHQPRMLLVFDYHAELDDHRETLDKARAQLGASSGVTISTLDALIEQGRGLAPLQTEHDADEDTLGLLIYTSGSTGSPKGAMYPRRLVTNTWRRSALAALAGQEAAPAITLNFLPMSHAMGREMVYSTLGAGGIAYFAASSDLSTFLDDLALVRPTQLSFVPRVWQMLHDEFERELERSPDRDSDPAGARAKIMSRQRRHVLGGRFVSAITGTAPMTPEMREWVEAYLDLPLREGYGSTETGAVYFEGQVQRPPVIDYKLADVPELGYFSTDRPHPRGELLVKTANMFSGYYQRPELTAEVFDEDGFYCTGDIVTELGPDRLAYLDRRNSVLKLSQGEFVAVTKLEAIFANAPEIDQIFLYGNSTRPYLLAVVVPTAETSARHDGEALKPVIARSLQSVGKATELQSYEIPRDFIIERSPFTLENGLLTGIRKFARPKIRARYAERLEQIYRDLAADQANRLKALRHVSPDAPALPAVRDAAGALLNCTPAELTMESHFTDIGGDSLSALSFANLLAEIFDVEVPVGTIVSPATDLRAIADFIDAARFGSVDRPTAGTVHGANAELLHAGDLTLEKFIDRTTLDQAPSLAAPTGGPRTVLLTGATGFLGRYLALEWLQRLSAVGGKVICLVRAKDAAGAHDRLESTFDSGDPELLRQFRKLAADHLEVIAGDKAEPGLGLDERTWSRLSETVDLIVDPAALVNHVLPYNQLFGPNVLGTAELIRLALTRKLKRICFVSTIGVGATVEPAVFLEDADVRSMSPNRPVNETYASGYASSKWAAEVLLREAHDLCKLPTSVFRCDMILADTAYAGQLNLPDTLTRTMLSLAATGIAPGSFYELDEHGERQRAHYDGLPVEFVAEAISTLGERVVEGFETYHVVNPHDDGIGMDQFVDWLSASGARIERVDDYNDWLHRFETSLRGLPERLRQASLLPLLHNFARPERPLNRAFAPADRFRAAVQEARVGPDKDIPHIGQDVISKYLTDLRLLGYL